MAYVYTCPDGFRFSARVNGDSALVKLPLQTVTLPHVISASGAKYEAGDVVFWSRGEQASLVLGRTNHDDCPGVRPATPWEEARLLGVEFRALGQEPGWLLEIDQERRLRFIGDYGSIRFAAPMLDPVRDSAGALTFRAQADAHEVTAVIRETPCQDVMSGEAFSHAVTVRFDGRELSGCGRTLSTSELTGRYWKLTELNGRPAIVAPAARETHLRLFADGPRVAGSTGCNRISGQFQRTGDRLRFGQLVTTRMACADPALNRQEQEFLRVLETVDRFTVQDESLTLHASDRPVARFMAVSLR